VRVYCDASALAKRYVDEVGSQDLENMLRSATALGLSVITVTEVVSALCRRRRESTVSSHGYAMAKASLLADVVDADTIEVSEKVLTLAIGLLEDHMLRSSDALQIASALDWDAELLVSADRQQCTAARAAGLQVKLLG
jgi:predicted nucleic acid-binding protein